MLNRVRNGAIFLPIDQFILRRERLKSALYLTLRKRKISKNMLRAIVKIQPSLQFQKYLKGIGTRLETHFFPNWKQQKIHFFMRKKLGFVFFSEKVSEKLQASTTPSKIRNLLRIERQMFGYSVLSH